MKKSCLKLVKEMLRPKSKRRKTKSFKFTRTSSSQTNN